MSSTKAPPPAHRDGLAVVGLDDERVLDWELVGRRLHHSLFRLHDATADLGRLVAVSPPAAHGDAGNLADAGRRVTCSTVCLKFAYSTGSGAGAAVAISFAAGQ